MARRVLFEGRREGRRFVFRQRPPLIHRLVWLMFALPLGTGAAFGVWALLGYTTGPATRTGYAVLTFTVVVWMLRLQTGDRKR